MLSFEKRTLYELSADDQCYINYINRLAESSWDDGENKRQINPGI